MIILDSPEGRIVIEWVAEDGLTQAKATTTEFPHVEIYADSFPEAHDELMAVIAELREAQRVE